MTMLGRSLCAMSMVCLLACGGSGSSSNVESEESAATDPPMPPLTTAEGVLRRLAAQREQSGAWPEETERIVHPGGADPLVGQSRDLLVRYLGEPNAAADFTTEGQLGWEIGQVESARMGHAPVLIVDVDASGTVTAARFRLSM